MHPKMHMSNGTMGQKTCNTMVGDDRPCFYKVITCETMEEIRIPPQFMKHLYNEMGDRATLKGPSDDAWTIGIHENEDGTYLQEGWQNFMTFHSLGKNEILLFQYDGNSHFSVRIYDQSGMERKSESVFTCKHQEDRNLEAESSKGRGKRGRPRKNIVSPNNLHQSKSCSEGEDGAGLSFPPYKLGRAKKYKRIEQAATNIEEEEMEPIDGEKGNRERKKEKEHHSKTIDYAQREIKEEKMDPTIDSQTIKPLIEEERCRVFEKEELFTSNFSFYKCCLKQSGVEKVFLLSICRSFSQAHFPPFRTHIVLRNSKGKGWVVNVIHAAGRCSFSGGWRSFVMDNGLKKGDACIFELVKRAEMQVHVFREGKRLSLLSEM